MAWVKTGRTRWRLSLFLRRVILQVQQQDDFYTHWIRWRDAFVYDMQDLEEKFGND